MTDTQTAHDARVGVPHETAPVSEAAPMEAARRTGTAPRPADLRRARFAESFSNVVAVLMRDPSFRNLPIGALEWLVLPPLMSGQWRLAQTRAEEPGANPGEPLPKGGLVIPAAVALWASVSDAIDARLADEIEKPLALKPHEWLCGNNLWLIAVAGDPRIASRLIKELDATVFKGRAVKLRNRGADGKPMITSSLVLKDAVTAR